MQQVRWRPGSGSCRAKRSNLLLWWMCICPVTIISALANRISLGDVDAPDFAARSCDEIGRLAESLSRMRRSLVQAIRMLEA